MLRRKNQLSVDENIWEAFFVFEKIEARGAASTGPAFGNEELKCLTWELRVSVWDLMRSGLMDDTVSQNLSSNTLSTSPWAAVLVRKGKMFASESSDACGTWWSCAAGCAGSTKVVCKTGGVAAWFWDARTAQHSWHLLHSSVWSCCEVCWEQLNTFHTLVIRKKQD